jgi:choline dehydrogenase
MGVSNTVHVSSVGILYPRGSALGGSSQINAMNLVWAPDNEWDHISELTGDDSWRHENMRRHLMDLENCTYVPLGTPGHGSDGYLEVSLTSKFVRVSPTDMHCSVQHDGPNGDYWNHLAQYCAVHVHVSPRN